MKRDSSPHPKVKRGHRQGASGKEKKDKKTPKGKREIEMEKKRRSAKGTDKADAADKGTNKGILRQSSYQSLQHRKKSNKSKKQNKGNKQSQRK